MRTTNRAGVLVLIGWTVAGAACRGDDDEPAYRALERVNPTKVSSAAGWSLFDRSIASGYVPDERVLTVELARRESITAIKVRGASPYSINVRARGGTSIGFPTVDLSTLSSGWHTIMSTRSTSTDVVELSFVPRGTAAPIPEVELWTLASDGSTAGTESIVSIAAAESSREIAPGTCEAFQIEVPRSPSLFRRAHLVYASIGQFRPFAIERSINGRAAVGGFWMPADPASAQAVTEEIDPESLALGKNTLRLCVPAAATTPVSLSDVRVIGELDTGDTHVTKVTVGNRDGAAVSDGRSDTTLPVAPGERLRLDLDRLISPDALVLDAAANVSDVECIGKDGTAAALPFEELGSLLRLDGGARACAAITATFDSAVSIGEIAVVGSGASERVDWARIVVTSPAEHFGAVAWISGFVARPPQMTGTLRVNIDAKASEPTSGEFGESVKRSADLHSDWHVNVAAHLSDGTQQLAKVTLASDRAGDVVPAGAVAPTAASIADAARYGALGATAAVDATMLGDAKIRLGTHAGIDIPAGAVVQPTRIQAKRLEHRTLPPLDPGMVNVTAPQGQGYEFLPHGQRFARHVEVMVPFDPKLIPDGMSANDVYTYFYDDSARRWRKLQRNSIDLGESTLRSGTDHFTTMINAVLAVPTSPTPLSFDPTALSSVAAASPAAGIDLIEAPSANSMGDARVGLPIRLPTGRGAYTPSLSIAYSSAADNGWLGVGWNVSMSRIEIDTRWGVPRYTDTEEPRYMLDGSELVPTLEVEGPTCMGGRRYHARIEGGYAHILRCGTNPSNFYWMVHDRDGTRFMYGRDSLGVTGNSSAASYKPRPCGSPPCGEGIYRWYVREVVDTYQNKTTFNYERDDIAGVEPARDVYPQSIQYTSHPSAAAAYSVEFVLDNGSRRDRLVTGRPGFKVMTRKLLRSIRVKFQSQVIREYVLVYDHGQFEKTLLKSVRMFGLGGCSASADAFSLPTCSGEYQEHSFEYHADAMAFDTVRRWCAAEGPMQCEPTAITTVLGKGSSKMWTGGLSIGAEVGGAFTASGSLSYSWGDRNERVGMYDLNGDGLVDQLYTEGDGTLRALLNDGHSFDVTSPTVISLSSLTPGPMKGLGADKNDSYSIDATLGAKVGSMGASASGGYSNATSRATRLFTEIDGDGFLDVLSAGGTSLTSAPCAGSQCFQPVTYDAIAAIDPAQDPMLAAFAAEIKERAVPGAPTMQWVAPYSGTIEVTGAVDLVRPGTVDGVSVGLYHDDSLLGGWSLINAGAPVTFTRTLQVVAGEGIYLYLSTGAHDGISGTVLTDEAQLTHGSPFMVRYTSACTDATCTQNVPALFGNVPTQERIFQFEGSQDLRVVSPRPFRAPVDGFIDVTGVIEKYRSEAPLRYCLQRFDGDVQRFDWRCDDPASPAQKIFATVTLPQGSAPPTPFGYSVTVSKGDLVVLRVEADYSFDPESIKFREATNQGVTVPRIKYTRACIPNNSGGCTNVVPPALDDIDLPVDHEAFGFFVAPVSPPQPHGAPPLVFVADKRCGYFIDPFPNPLGPGKPITIALRTDRQGTIQSPTPFQCTNTCTVPSPGWFELYAGESLSIEITADPLVMPPVTTTIPISCDHTFYYTAPLIFRNKHADPITTLTPFVGGYRGWNVTFWNEDEDFAPAKLIDSYTNPYALPGCAVPPATPPDPALCRANLEQAARTAITPTPAFDGTSLTEDQAAWIAQHSAAFIRPYIGKLHAADIGGVGSALAGTPGTGGSLFSKEYLRLSGTRSYYAGFNASTGGTLPVLPGISGAGLSATVSLSSTETTTDVIDLSGDGIADVVQGSRLIEGVIGGVAKPPVTLPFDRIRKRAGFDYAISASGNASVAVTTPSGRRRLQFAQKSDSDAGGGVSGGLSIGRSQTTDELVDINADGLPDVVQRRGGDIKVRYNFGSYFGALETIDSLDPAFANEQADTFEGFERATNALGEALVSTNNALSHDTTLTRHETYTLDLFYASFSYSTRKTSSRTTRQLVDINGDGLPDLLFKRSDSPIIKVQFNTGAGFGPVRDWTTPTWHDGAVPLELSPFPAAVTAGSFGLTGADVLAGTSTQVSESYGGKLSSGTLLGPIKTSVSVSRSRDEDTYELALMDINGDGRPDHVLRREQNGSPNRIYVKNNLVSGKGNLLTMVHRPLGGTIKLDYMSTGNSVDMPHSRQVLSRVEIDDGSDLGADLASPNLVTTYKYENGYYDRREKEFFGFAKVVAQRPGGGTIEQLYENSTFTLHGLLKSELHKDSTSATVYERHFVHKAFGVIGPMAYLSADPACVAAMPLLLQRVPNNDACTPKLQYQTEEREVRGELGTTTTKTRTIQTVNFDRFGNPTVVFDAGDAAITTDNVYSLFSYNNDTTRWILGRPNGAYVRAGTMFSPNLRIRNATYYPEGKVRDVTVETGNGPAVTKLAYDAYGNLARLETPPNNNSETQTYTISFDTTVSTYPVSVVDAFGYASSATYDVRFGVATTETDTNGAQLVRTLDGFGRLSSVQGPYDSAASPALSLQYFPNENPPRAVTVTRTSAPPGFTGTLPPPITTVTIADGLARPIQVRKTAVVEGVPGMTTTGLVQRDVLGRVTKTWQPFFTAGASTSFVTPVTANATSTEYDALDRVTKTTHPDGTFETTSYAIATSPTGPQLFKTRHVIAMSPIDRVREQYVDHLDQVRAHVEYPTATTPSTTAYDYAPTGELRRIVDAEGTVTTIGYDLRGLRTSLDNPDTGQRREFYDRMGNRTALIEPNHKANNTSVQFFYERNRLKTILYSSSKPSVTYDYGAPGATEGRAGRVTRVTDETGSVEYSYGALGETRRTLRTFEPAGSTQPLYFEHRFTTDSLGRQLELRYPDGELVTNVYDDGGMLAEVRGEGDGWQRVYATGMRYDKFGNRTRMQLGQVVTTWSFDPVRVRLDSITSTVQTSSTKIQDLHYAYDAANNPTSIANNLAPLTAVASAIPGASSLTLTYDGVDRLKRVVGTAQLDPTRTTTYDQTFDYTPSHNLQAKSRVHLINDGVTATAPPATNFTFSYQYNATRPHLPFQVGDLQLQYDPSGNPFKRTNTTSGLQQTLVWDDDNRLVQLTDTSGVSQQNLYDANGLRVRRKSSGSTGTRTTIFASQYFDLNGEQPSSEGGVKHIFAGELRIASVLGSFASSATPAAPATPGTPYYLHADHLGSTGVVTDEDGSVHQSIEYFADGEMWIDRAPTTPTNGYLFNGKPFDAETGFYDYGQRFYDPRTSTWLGADPAVLQDPTKATHDPRYLSVVAFSGHNPYRFRDYDGGDFFWIHDNTVEYVKTLPFSSRPDDAEAPRFEGILADGEGAELIERDAVRAHGVISTGEATSGYAPLEKIPLVGQIVGRSNAIWGLGEQYIEGKSAPEVDLANADPMAFAPSMPGTSPPTTKQKPQDTKVGRSPPRASTGGGCFVAGTLIQLRTGTTAIEDVRVGDLVASRAQADGAITYRRVVRVYDKADVLVVEVTVSTPAGAVEVIRTTNEHPFWVSSVGWQSAGYLRAGDELLSKAGERLRVVDVVETGDRETVYNLEVERDHTYFVGRIGAWVHNKPMRAREPEFGAFKDHARRHSLPNQTNAQYYQAAVRNTQFGRAFNFRHNGMGKKAYVTRTGPDSFTFTSTSRSGRRIFTHIYNVNEQYLRNIGITLPQNF